MRRPGAQTLGAAAQNKNEKEKSSRHSHQPQNDVADLSLFTSSSKISHRSYSLRYFFLPP
jgi:hypothetical protein